MLEGNYVLRKYCVNASIQRLEDNIRKRRRLITPSRNNKDNTNINQTKITRKQKLEGKTSRMTFKAINKRIITREFVNMVKKVKTLREELNSF